MAWAAEWITSLSRQWAGFACVGLIFVYVALFSLGPGPIPWFLISELIPQHARSEAQGLVMVVANVVSLGVTFLTLPAFDALGSAAFLPLFVLPTAALTAFLYKTLPETRGREIPDIVAELQGPD